MLHATAIYWLLTVTFLVVVAIVRDVENIVANCLEDVEGE